MRGRERARARRESRSSRARRGPCVESKGGGGDNDKAHAETRGARALRWNLLLVDGGAAYEARGVVPC